MELALFNFIFYNFREAFITVGLIFHCWERPALFNFTVKASNEGFFMQYVDINRQLGMDFYPHLKGQYFKRDRPILGVFLDMNCAHSFAILNASSNSHIFNEHFHWILFERSGDMEAFQKFAQEANFCVSSDVTYVLADHSYNRPKGNSSRKNTFTSYDVYNNGPMIGGKLNITVDRRFSCDDIECRIEQYLSLLRKRSKFGNRNSQNDLTFRIATIVALPLTLPVSEKLDYLYSNDNIHIDPVLRFGFRQALLLMEMFKANYNLIFFDRWAIDDIFGGSLSSILEGHSDLSSTPIAMTTTRLKYFQILIETCSFRSICLFRTPRTTGLSSSGKAFLDPFTTSVWIAFGVILLISSVQLWVMFFVEFRRMPKNLDHAPSLLTSCLISLGTACIQGSYILPGSVGGRTTYTVIAMATFIMFNYYTSIIVSTLLGTPVKSDIKTVGQLADSPLEVGFEPRPWIFAYLNSSQVPAVRRLVKKKIENRKNPYSAWIPVTEALLRLRDEIGTFAYVFEASSGFVLVEKYYKPEEICDLNEVKLRPESTLANQLPMNSTFKELTRLRLMRLVETGVNRRFTTYWLRNRLNCFASNTIVEVSLEYTAPLFLMMLLCYVICIFVLLLEIIYNRFGNRKAIEKLCLT